MAPVRGCTTFISKHPSDQLLQDPGHWNKGHIQGQKHVQRTRRIGPQRPKMAGVLQVCV